MARIAFGFQFQAVASLGPTLISRFHMDYAGLGTLIGVYMLPGVFTALPMGLLGRRFGDRVILGGGLLLMAVGGAISAVSPSFEAIAVGRVVAGVGAVAMSVLQSKVIADWFSGPRFMLGLSISVGSYPIGVGLSQIAVPLLAGQFGLAAPFLAGAAAMAASATLFLGSYRPAPHARPVPRDFSFPSGRECLLLIIGGLIWTSYTGGYAGYLAYLPSLMQEQGHGLAVIALVGALATWGNAPSTLVGGGLAARFGTWRVFLAGTCCLFAGVLGVGLADWPVLFALLIGFPGSMQSGVIMAVGTLSARTENRAAGMGLFYTVYYLGGSAVPAMCGRAADLYGGAQGAMFAAALVVVVALPMYLLHRRLASHETMLARA